MLILFALLLTRYVLADTIAAFNPAFAFPYTYFEGSIDDKATLLQSDQTNTYFIECISRMFIQAIILMTTIFL